MDKKIIIILIQIIIVFSIIAIITLLLRMDQAIKLEKRIARYSVKNNKKSSNDSLVERIWNSYIKFVKRQRKKIKKIFPTLSKMYDKYSVGSRYRAEDYITHKLVISILFCGKEVLNDFLTFFYTNFKGEI